MSPLFGHRTQFYSNIFLWNHPHTQWFLSLTSCVKNVYEWNWRETDITLPFIAVKTVWSDRRHMPMNQTGFCPLMFGYFLSTATSTLPKQVCSPFSKFGGLLFLSDTRCHAWLSVTNVHLNLCYPVLLEKHEIPTPHPPHHFHNSAISKNAHTIQKWVGYYVMTYPYVIMS